MFSSLIVQIDKLVDESSSAISFVNELGLPLHDVIQLGGHTQARTHRLQGQPIGAALMKTLAGAASARENIQLVTGAGVSRLCHVDCSKEEGGGKQQGGKKKITSGNLRDGKHKRSHYYRGGQKRKSDVRINLDTLLLLLLLLFQRRELKFSS